MRAGGAPGQGVSDGRRPGGCRGPPGDGGYVGGGVWLGEERVGKGFRLHQCKGEVKSRKVF